MANAIATQVLEDGPRNSIIKVTITSDGSGEITNSIIYDSSAYQNDQLNTKLMKITYDLQGFSGTLYWSANVPVQLINLIKNFTAKINYFFTGGLINNAGTGKNGDILLTTQGLAAAPVGTTGEIILYVKKKRP